MSDCKRAKKNQLQVFAQKGSLSTKNEVHDKIKMELTLENSCQEESSSQNPKIQLQFVD